MAIEWAWRKQRGGGAEAIRSEPDGQSPASPIDPRVAARHVMQRSRVSIDQVVAEQALRRVYCDAGLCPPRYEDAQRHPQTMRSHELPPQLRPPWYACAAMKLGRFLLSALCKIEIRGQLPASGAVIVSNHPTYLDGALGLMLGRTVRPVARLHAGNPVINGLVKAGHCVITGKGNGTDAASEWLMQGGYVWLAPEGRINPGIPQDIRSGAARMAVSSGAPIVPMMVEGATGWLQKLRRFERPRITVTLAASFGAVREHADAEANVQATKGRILTTLQRLLASSSEYGPGSGAEVRS